MQEVKNILDTKLKNNDTHLVYNILSFIDDDPDFVIICKECGCVDKQIGLYSSKCKICRNKDMVVIEMKNQMKTFEYLENRQKGYYYKHFSQKLNEYFSNMFSPQGLAYNISYPLRSFLHLSL